MTDDQILCMVSDLVQEVDHDLWKEYFVPGADDEEEQAEGRRQLLAIAKYHLQHAKRPRSQNNVISVED